MIKNTIPKHLCKTVACMKRKKHHPLLRHIHKKHNISYKTLFYMKEYGPHSHVSKNIIRESIKVLILASVISSIGGVHIKSVQSSLITIIPLLILLPALNDMIGDFGTIMSSKFTTMLYLKRIGRKWWTHHELHKLIITLMSVAIISSVYISVLSIAMSVYRGYAITQNIAINVLFVSLASTLIIVGIICLVSIIGGIFIYRRKEDPNNFLIPITTSVADLGSMLIFAFFVSLLF